MAESGRRLRSRSQSETPASAADRVSKHRRKQRGTGARQISAFVEQDAVALLAQMVQYSGRSQGQLLSAALRALARDYDYWEVEPPYDDVFDDDLYPPYRGGGERDDEWHDQLGWRNQPERVPPWIVEQERLEYAERMAARKQFGAVSADDGLAVYRQGYRRVTGNTKAK